jgi:hypothetical protein
MLLNFLGCGESKRHLKCSDQVQNTEGEDGEEERRDEKFGL